MIERRQFLLFRPNIEIIRKYYKFLEYLISGSNPCVPTPNKKTGSNLFFCFSKNSFL